MRQLVRSVVKKILVNVLPDSDRFRTLAYWPKFEAWRKNYASDYPVFTSRLEIYDYINSEIVHDKPLQYLEFGVYKGASIKYFSNLSNHNDSRFVGFDTFTGLPEDWVQLTGSLKRAAFDAGGELPRLDDARVLFVKGLFQDTLPEFLENYNSTSQLIIHNDSDLYSSTMYMLTNANDIIVPGTVIIFDEFNSVMHEFRALEDYCAAYMRSYEIIAATRDFLQVAVRMR